LTSALRISVVTPNFNMGRYLERTIQSVLMNLAPGDEYFVIDGGSKDESREVIQRYDKRITAWISEPDESYADAIAKGFARASGDVLCWINSGDLYLNGAFALARREMSGGDGLVFGSDFYIDDADRIIRYSHGHVSDLREAMLFGGWSPLQDACFWRRDLYKAVGGLDPKVRYAADYDLFLRLSLATQARFSRAAYSAFRQHSGQKSAAGAAQYAAEKETVRARELAKQRISGTPAAARRVLARARMSWRARTSQIRYRREDLHGRDISSLSAAQYWPRT
jgi:glycosyltransferase involved in cell wall biosynthesis